MGIIGILILHTTHEQIKVIYSIHPLTTFLSLTKSMPEWATLSFLCAGAGYS